MASTARACARARPERRGGRAEDRNIWRWRAPSSPHSQRWTPERRGTGTGRGASALRGPGLLSPSCRGVAHPTHAFRGGLCTAPTHARTHAGRDRGLWLNRVGPRFSLFDPFSLPHCDCDSDRTPTGQARQQHRTDRNSARGGRSIVPFCLCCAAYPPRLFFFPVLYRNFYVKLTAEIDFTTRLNSKFASKISCKFCMCTHKRCRCIYVPPQYMMFITEWISSLCVILWFASKKKYSKIHVYIHV
jgi:hypothetical protein